MDVTSDITAMHIVFEEVFREAPVLTRGKWTRSAIGKGGGLWLKKEDFYREDPAGTGLSEAENTEKTTFTMLDGVPTALLRKALEDGLLTQERFDHYMDGTVAFGFTVEGKIRRYPYHCPKCGNRLTILIPMESWWGAIPSCPFCGGTLLSLTFDNRDKAALLSDIRMGATPVASYALIFPQEDGESEEAYRERVISLAESRCTEWFPEDPAYRSKIVRLLLERNPYLTHLLPQIFRLLTDGDAAFRAGLEEKLKSVTLRDNGESVLNLLGQSFYQMHIPTQNRAQPLPPKTGVKKRFCPNCGTPASGKFCRECGTKLI